MASTTGRRVERVLTNKSGGAVIAGDVVVIDSSNDDAFTTTTSAGVTNTVGIVQESIANNASGRVLLSGEAALVNVNASVTRGNYAKTYTVAKQASDAGSSRGAGTFGKFTTGGTTPKAIIWQPDLGAGSGVSSGTSMPGSPSDGDLYYRTDLDLMFRYRSSGTRWVCTCPHEIPFSTPTTLFPISATASGWGGIALPVSRGMDILVEDYDVAFFVASGASALSASHKWIGTIIIRGTGTTVGTITIDSGANDTWRNASDTGDDVVDCTSAEVGLGLTWTKTGTPGNLTGGYAKVSYRFIGV